MAEPLKVTFFPPLYLQRRIWVLDVLRREGITSVRSQVFIIIIHGLTNCIQVVDIGCGEGELLACLAQPAPWLRPPPDSMRHRRSTSSDHNSDNNSNLVTVMPDEIANLHCTKLQGLDISFHDLQYAIMGTTPPPSNSQSIRWEPLEAKIWHGDLEFVNPEFVDVECIVSTEVCVTSYILRQTIFPLMI